MGVDRISCRFNADRDLLRETGRGALLFQDGLLRFRGKLEEDAVDRAALALAEVGDPPSPELALDVDDELVAAQDRGCPLREQPGIDAVLPCPLAEVPRGADGVG